MTRVTSKGQVTIPKEIREELGIRPGDDIDFELTNRGCVLTKEIDANRFERWKGAADTDETVEERMEALRGGRE